MYILGLVICCIAGGMGMYFGGWAGFAAVVLAETGMAITTFNNK